MRSVWNHLHRTLTVTLVILTSFLPIRVFLHTYSPLLSLDILVRRSTRGGLFETTDKLLSESSNHSYLGSTVLPGSSSQLNVRLLPSTASTVPFTVPFTIPPTAESRGSRNTVLGKKSIKLIKTTYDWVSKDTMLVKKKSNCKHLFTQK